MKKLLSMLCLLMATVTMAQVNIYPIGTKDNTVQVQNVLQVKSYLIPGVKDTVHNPTNFGIGTLIIRAQDSLPYMYNGKTGAIQQWYVLAGPHTVTSVNGLTGAVTIIIPTNNNQLTNGSSYITAAQAPVLSVNGQTGIVTIDGTICHISQGSNIVISGLGTAASPYIINGLASGGGGGRNADSVRSIPVDTTGKQQGYSVVYDTTGVAEGGLGKFKVVALSNTFAALTDVFLTSPANGDLLKYNTSLSKWVNFASPYLTSIAGITAGGDLSGSYPNPTVAKLNNLAASYYLNYVNLTNTPTVLSRIAPIDSLSRVTNGLQLSGISIVPQSVNGSFPGLVTPSLFATWNSKYGPADTLSTLVTQYDLSQNSDSIRTFISNDSVYMGITIGSNPETVKFQYIIPTGGTLISQGSGYPLGLTGTMQIKSLIARPGLLLDTATTGEVAVKPDTTGSTASPLQTKYRSDTARFNVYAAIAGINTHDTTSGNALQTKYRSDTSRTNIYGAIGSVNTHDTTSGNALQSKYRTDTMRVNVYGAIGSVNTHDTTSANALQPKYRTDTMRTDLYAAIAGVNTHDTTSANALQSKYRSDTARANLYAGLAGKVANGGASKSITAGALSSRPAASNCQCYWFSTTDSTFSYDNGIWNLLKGGSSGGSGGSPNTSVGAGYPVAITGTNNVKSITSNTGTGAKLDTIISNQINISNDTANVLLAKALPSGQVFVGNGSNKAYAGNLWPSEQPIDTIYAPKYVTPSDYTVNGSAALTSAGVLSGGSSGVYTNFLTVGFPAAYPYWTYQRGFRVTTETSNSGIAFGLHSVNTSNKYDIGVNIPLTTAGSTPIYAVSFGASQTFTTSSGNLTYSPSDSFLCKMSLGLNTFTSTVYNITVGGSDSQTVVKTWATPTPGGAGNYYPNSGYFTTYALGGTQTLGPETITSSWTKNPSGLFLGDSRMQYAGSDWISSPADSLSLSYPHVTNWCDEGSGTPQFLASQQSIFNLNAKTIFFFVGSNYKRAGATDAQEAFQDDSLMQAWGQKGYRVFLCVIPEDSLKSGVGMTAIKNRDSTVYAPMGAYIDIWNPLTNGTNILASANEFTDGIHWSTAGRSVVYRAILNSGKMVAVNNRTNFLQHDGLFTKLGAGQINLDTNKVHNWIAEIGTGSNLNQVLALGNSSSTPINITGYNATGPNISASNWNFQDASAGNGFINYGTYVGASGLTHSYSGFGVGFQAISSQLMFHTEGTGTINTIATAKYPIKADSSGNVDIGGNVSPNLGNDTGSTVQVKPATYSLTVTGKGGTSVRGLISKQVSSDGFPGALTLLKYDGTIASPTAIANGQYLGAMYFGAWDGTNLTYPGFIGAIANGTVSTGSIPSDIVISTGSATNGTERFRIYSGGQIAFEGDTISSVKRISYTSNLGSSFGIRSCIDKGYDDSARVAAIAAALASITLQSAHDSSGNAASTRYVDRAIGQALAGFPTYINPKLFAMTADGTVSNTTTPTSLIGTGVGSQTIAANALSAGSVIKFSGSGNITTTLTAPGLAFNLTIGGVNNVINPTIGTSLNSQYEFEATAVVRTTGSSGSIQVTGSVTIAGVKTYFANSSPQFINTTSTCLVDLILTMSGTVGSGDALTTKNATIILQ